MVVGLQHAEAGNDALLTLNNHHLDVFLLNEGSHSVFELPGKCETTLRPTLNDGQTQVTELIFALHVVLTGKARVLCGSHTTAAV